MGMNGWFNVGTFRNTHRQPLPIRGCWTVLETVWKEREIEMWRRAVAQKLTTHDQHTDSRDKYWRTTVKCLNLSLKIVQTIALLLFSRLTCRLLILIKRCDVCGADEMQACFCGRQNRGAAVMRDKHQSSEGATIRGGRLQDLKRHHRGRRETLTLWMLFHHWGVCEGIEHAGGMPNTVWERCWEAVDHCWCGRGNPTSSCTNLALLSLRHQCWRGGSERQPWLVARAVESGTLDLVVTGQGSVTIPSVYEGRVPRDFPLGGDETPQVLRWMETEWPGTKSTCSTHGF